MVAVAGAVLFLCAVGAFALPDPAVTRFLPPCPFRAVTGLYCPGCGSGRALYQLAHGHLAAAFRLNPLMVLAIPFLLVAQFGKVTGRTPRRPRFPGLAWALLGVIVLYGIARNIPANPFRLLAPRPAVSRGT